MVERGDGELDVLADLAYPLPTVVICELLGVPVADRESFKGWAAGASRLLDNYLDQAALMEGMAAGMELFRYFSDLVEERRAHPGRDLLERPDRGRGGGRPALPRRAAQHRHPAVRGRLRDHHEPARQRDAGPAPQPVARSTACGPTRASCAPAVEELIRYDGPVHITARIATTDVEIGGQLIREGEQVAVSLGAANRDPEQFPDPDRLDVGRTPNRHLGLGGGPHFCLGATLARIEAQAAFGAVLRRFPHLELATEHPTYRDHFVIRGLTGLKVRITPPPG